MTTYEITCLVSLYLVAGIACYAATKAWFQAEHDILVCVALMITWPIALVGAIMAIVLWSAANFAEHIVVEIEKKRKEKKR